MSEHGKRICPPPTPAGRGDSSLGAPGELGAHTFAGYMTMATHALREIVSGSDLGSFGGDLDGLTAWVAVALAAAGRVFRRDD